ncbi:peptidoglycan-binding protein [Candidatus Poriferisocius sp.]|uniref:peptidoglycan-binding protein n=1 Tax=Candidatus Poriferisocius sp. TaxID=3101276 RepID=UPI003B5ADF51
MRLPALPSTPLRLAVASLAVALAMVAACGPAADNGNEVATTDPSELLPDGLFDALERIDGMDVPENPAEPPATPAPEPDDNAAEDGQTLVPAQADTEDGQSPSETSQEELLRLRDEAFVDFSRCIREEGFTDFPDIDSSQVVDQASFLQAMQDAGVSFTQAGLGQALQACASVFSELIALAPQQDGNVQQVEQEENALAFARCMRDQGLDDFPDPDFNQFPNTGFNTGGNNAANLDDETQAALEVCLPTFGGGEPNRTTATPGEASGADTPATASATPATAASTQAPEATTTQAPSPDPATTAAILRDTEELNTAEVVRRDLIDTEEFSGTLGFGDPEPLYTNSSGIVTGRLPEEGDILDVGDTLFEVSGHPVILLRGDRPMYRDFHRDMEDGPDVEQLEQALVDMDIPGWDGMTVDHNFTPVTEDVVEEWQNRLGVEETGEVRMGQIVFIEEPIRISAVNVTVGQSVSAQQAAFTVTGQYQEITSDIDPGDADIVNRLDPVEVELPDGRLTPGVVSEVARVATRLPNAQTGAPGDPTIEVVIVLLDDEASSRFDAAPVNWTITKEVTRNALVVPASALIATVDGGFSVEVVHDGSTTLVPVEVGTFVDAFVQITGGDLDVGDQVRIP